MNKFKKVFVIGSNSFSGSNFVNYLLKNTNYDIIGISRSPEYNSIFLSYLYKKQVSSRFKFHQLDLNKNLTEIINLLDAEKPEIIVNFAAQGEVRTSWNNPSQWFQTNCVAVVNLITELKEKKYIRKYIHTSTPEVYGSCPGKLIEHFLYSPSTPYAASKASADLFLMMMKKICPFEIILTRAANVYGVHQQLYRIIPRTIIYLKLGRKIQLHNHGFAKRSFIHIFDVCSAMLKIIESNKHLSPIYHLSPDSEPIAIADIVSTICNKMGYNFNESIELAEKPIGQDNVYNLDSSRAKEELDWKPVIRFEEGIDGVIQWINESWEKIKKQPLEYIHKE